MSQEHDESFNSVVGSEDNDDDNQHSNKRGGSQGHDEGSGASDSDSSGGSDSASDSDSSSSSNASNASRRRSSGGGQGDARTSMSSASQNKTKTSHQQNSGQSSAAMETGVARLAQESNGGYSDDDSEDDESDSNSDSSGSDSNEDDVDAQEKNAPVKSKNSTFNSSNRSHNTTASSTSTTNTSTTTRTNTSNTTNTSTTSDEEGDEDEAGEGERVVEDEDEDMEKAPSTKFKVNDVHMVDATKEGNAVAEEEGDQEEMEEDEGSDSEPSASSEEEASPTSSSSSSDDDDEDEYQPQRSRRQQAKRGDSGTTKKTLKKKAKSQNWDSDESNGDSDDEQEEDDSEDDSPQPTRRRTTSAKSNKSKEPQKKSRKAAYSSDDDDEKKKFHKRRAATTVSYKEPSEDDITDSEDLVEVEYDESQMGPAEAGEEDKSETIERVLAQRIGKKGCTGNQTTMYAMEETGVDPNEGVDENDEENTERQFLIKWKGWSYIHNTWESEDSLREQKVKGIKKLENFVRKEQELDYWRRSAGPEDIDYFECQQELQNDLLKSYNNVDRIIARNVKEDGTCEYLCKWQSLPYSEATWEDTSLVSRKWSRCIEQFEEREESKCTPSRHCKVLKYRPKFYKFKVQPEFIGEGLLLRDYQMDGLNWLLHSWCKENSVILADEMGLGKTVQAISFLYSLFKVHHLYGPFLCVVPLSTMTAWQRESELWAPDMNVVTYLGDVKSREMIRQFEWQFDGSKRLKFNCILTTYEIVLKDKLFLGQLQWAVLLVDEAHRLKNDDSLLYKSLKEFETNHRLLITGTPLQNSLKELWALLHFIMPEKFVTWEDFEAEHGNAADKGYTKLHQQLEPYILRRVKKDVEKSLPAKVEQILRVEMTSLQKQYYKWILTRNFDALRKGKKGSTSTFLNIVIELKKCCNHGALIRPSEFDVTGMAQDEALQALFKGSGKLVLLDKLLCRLKETGHRVLIFSQMVRMLDILAEYLQKRHFSFQRLDGSIKGEMRRQALDHFNAEGSQDFCFLLSTRAGGLGINLATADTVIIFDSDWNPQNDLQAQARAHRIGQKNQVNIYRLVTARSVEEQIVERAKQKMVLDHLVIQRMDTTGRTVLDKSSTGSSNSTPFNKDDLSAILKFGAEELFKDEQENDDELVCDIDEILRRAETRNEDPEMPGDDLLSAFKVASIAAFEEDPTDTTKDNDPGADDEDTKDWDDIIPEGFRKTVEDQERAKEMEDLYLPPRRKTAANNQESPTKRGRKGQPDDSADSDYECGSDGSGEDGRPKRRGRPTNKEKIMGFTDAEIRRFIKSYKKFPAPLERLEAIACDAELQEKPMAELRRMGEMLHDRCVQFLEDHKEELKNATAPPVKVGDENTKQRRSRATYSVKLGGVSFNAKTLLSCEEELNPLNELMPRNTAERQCWQLTIKTRPANFDTDWGVEEDSKLLCGIYQYGIGSWEQMKMDPNLKLTDKILFNDARKPQAKHLQSRAEYLLKIIKKNVELRKGQQKKQRKPRKGKDAKAGSAPGANGSPDSKSRLLSECHGEELSQSGDTERRMRNRENFSYAEADNGGSNDGDSPRSKKKAKRNAISSKTNKSKGPMHFTANNEPRALEVLGDLDPTVFNECKEKMRPVKKALKALDRPDVNLSNQDKVKHTRECLLLIGRQIDLCLENYKEPERKEWRSNLWYFVSKFTEFDAKKLFKLYKHAIKTEEEETKKKKSKKSKSLKQENGAEKEKSAKKKKKDKEKDKEAERYGVGGYDKSKRVDSNSPIKRKREDHEFGLSGGSSLTAGMPSFKRVHVDRGRDERKKLHRDDYYGGGNSHDGPPSGSRGDRRNSLNSPSTSSNRNMHASNSRLPPLGSGGYSSNAENRNASPYMDGGSDRWGHNRDRYVNDYNRDRYDTYGSSRAANVSYHRDHRDRERDRDRRIDKRRYAPSHGPPMGYPPHYLGPPLPAYYMANGALPLVGGIPAIPYRGDPRYMGGAGDWSREGGYPPQDYRRSDYDRRQQT